MLNITKTEIRQFSDYLSLKRKLENKYKLTQLKEISAIINQDAVVGEATVQNVGSTISDIGSDPATLVCQAETDDGVGVDNDGKIVTFHYITNEGEKKTSTCTLTATANATPVAFDPAIDDFYCPNLEDYDHPASISEAPDDYIDIKVAGGTTYAKIIDGATGGRAADYLGVGSVYANYVADHSDGHNTTHKLEYLTPWGDVKTAESEFKATTTTTATILTSEDGGNIVDFWRPRSLELNKVTTSDSGLFRISNLAKDTHYCGVAEGYWKYLSTRYWCPTGRKAWLARMTFDTAGNAEVKASFTQLGASLSESCLAKPLDFFRLEPGIPLEPLKELKISIKRVGASDVNGITCISILEVEE